MAPALDIALRGASKKLFVGAGAGGVRFARSGGGFAALRRSAPIMAPTTSWPLKQQRLLLPLARKHSSAAGGRGKYPSEGVSSAFPDSWVCPDTLWDASSKAPDTVDDRFDAEFGSRNQAWREKILKEDPTIFETIGKGQAPKYLWIGCCDSRVAAENLINAKPGEVFVHRNIANMVVSTDTNLRSVLKYAVEYLKVEHIIVCGHYDCGGVKASCSKADHQAPLESWLANIRDVYRLHQKELDAIINPEERHKRLVELNVIEQCLNLFKTGDVQRRRSETGSRLDQYECAFPRIHGMVFAPSDGILRKLPIDFKQYLKKYKTVYQMYDSADFLASTETAS